MSFATALSRCPTPFDADRGQEAATRFPNLSADLRALIAGAAGSSPYLDGLLRKEAEWLPAALDDPEGTVTRVIADLDTEPLASLPAAMRAAKRRVALMTALGDLGGAWPLEQVTGVLTRLADQAVDRALKALFEAELARGKLPGMGPEDIATAGGMSVLAMGKMGAEELNYSSDIDLICLYDESRTDPADETELRAGFVRITRRMTRMLSDVTADGYVLRTDLRLRPDASVTPVCISMAAAERYYESVGRTWERAAFIKARPCAGDLAAGARFLDTLTPFVWRKHLDFAAIQDAHDMRLRIRAHKGLHGPISLPGHDMKLGRGGIREIEFFTQTRQLIAGGRDAGLRDRRTLPALAALQAAGWVPEEAALSLHDHYRFHREIEHRVQMINDAQTHALPTSDEGFDRLAALCGRPAGALRTELTERLSAVHELTEGFFAPEPARPPGADSFGEETTARWPGYPALRSARAVTIFERLKPDLMRRLQRAARPDEALAQFDGFLAGLPAGVQLFSLFEANPTLVDLIVDICASAPALAQYLSRNASVFDAVIGGDFFAPWPGQAALEAGLTAALSAETDYERKLDTARRWTKEWHFRVGVHHLRGLMAAPEAGAAYADLARAVVVALWPEVVAQFAAKHGAPPGRGAAVVAMGSLGAGRLQAGSDLDLIVIYDEAGVEASDGRRPLAARAYYARLTQALVTALTAPMAEGRLYEVDMRLRPSGRQGPVATSWGAYQSYQRDEAWTWEHLALTRALPLTGPAELLTDIEAFRQGVLATPRDAAQACADVIDMRRRLAEAKPPEGPWDVKLGPGGLQDIELFAQTAAMLSGAADRPVADQLDRGVAGGWFDAADRAALMEAYQLSWQVRALGQLLASGPLVPESLGQGAVEALLRGTEHPGLDTLAAHLETATGAAAKIITGALAAPPKGNGRP